MNTTLAAAILLLLALFPLGSWLAEKRRKSADPVPLFEFRSSVASALITKAEQRTQLLSDIQHAFNRKIKEKESLLNRALRSDERTELLYAFNAYFGSAPVEIALFGNQAEQRSFVNAGYTREVTRQICE